MNMDNILKNKLRGHEMAFSNSLWSDIEVQLDTRQKKWAWWHISLLAILGISLLGLIMIWGKSSQASEIASADVVSSPIPPKGDENLSLSALGLDENVNKRNNEASVSELDLIGKSLPQTIAKESVVDALTPEIATPEIDVLPNAHIPASTSERTEKSTSQQTNERDNLILDLPKNNREISSSENMMTLQYLRAQPLSHVASPPRLRTKIDCPVFGKKSPGLYFDIYWNSEFAMRSLDAKNIEFEEYKAQRNDSESSLYSYSLGARFIYLSPKNWFLKAGLNYTQINEKFQFAGAETIRFEIQEVVDPVTGEVTRDTLSITPGRETLKIFNKYRMVDIPILVGYEKALSKDFSLTVSGGIHFNIIFRQKGRMISHTTGQPAIFTSSEKEIEAFKTNMGVSLALSGGILYHWKPRIDLFAEPVFRYYLKSATISTYPLEQNYLNVGLSLGARFRL